MRGFEIKIKSSALSQREKKQLLTECFDILFANSHKKRNKNANLQKYGRKNIQNK